MEVDTAIVQSLKTELTNLIEEEIDVEDSFYDAGGNSMLAIQFLSWIAEQYDVDLTVKDLFENNIVELSAIISKGRANCNEKISVY